MGECSDCSKPLGQGNASGFCRACCARRNGHTSRAKMAATMRQRIASDPEYKKRLGAQLAAHSRTPEARQHARQRLLDRPIFHLGQAGCGGAGSPARTQAGQSHTNRRLAWCPPDYRQLYRTLLSKKLGAANARAATLDQYQADMRKFRRSMGAE